MTNDQIMWYRVGWLMGTYEVEVALNREGVHMHEPWYMDPNGHRHVCNSLSMGWAIDCPDEPTPCVCAFLLEEQRRIQPVEMAGA